MSEFWTYALESAGSHLGAGWFWLFPLVFAIHDAEEATSVWIKGSLHNSDILHDVGCDPDAHGYLFRVDHLYGGRRLGGGAGCVTLAIFTFAVLLGGYTAHGFVHLYLGWRAHGYTLGVATALPLVVFGGVLIYAKLIETGTLSWTLAASQFCSRRAYHVALDPRRSPGRPDLRLRSVVLQSRKWPDSNICIPSRQALCKCWNQRTTS